MSFEDPIYMHGEWKVRFKTSILGRSPIDVNVIGRDTACDVGRWMHDRGREKFSDRADYQRTLAAHKRFHDCARAAAEAINRQDYKTAERLIAPSSDYDIASKELINALNELGRDFSIDYAAHIQNTPEDLKGSQAQQAKRQPDTPR